jgi:hypothetical protein
LKWLPGALCASHHKDVVEQECEHCCAEDGKTYQGELNGPLVLIELGLNAIQLLDPRVDVLIIGAHSPYVIDCMKGVFASVQWSLFERVGWADPRYGVLSSRRLIALASGPGSIELMLIRSLLTHSSHDHPPQTYRVMEHQSLRLLRSWSWRYRRHSSQLRSCVLEPKPQ